MKVINLGLIPSLLLILNSFSTLAWDRKISTGQVLSNNEGEEGVHDFASPSEQAKLMENYAEGGDQVGVFNNNLFIMQDDGIISVPMGEITGIGKEELNEVINEAFVEYEVKTVKKYVEMPPEDIAKMDAEKLGKVPPKALAQMGEGQIKAIPHKAMAGLKPEMMGALPPQVIQHFDPEHFEELSPEVFGEMKVDMLNAVDPRAFENFNPEQMKRIVVPKILPGMQPLPPLPGGGPAFQMPELNQNFAQILPAEAFHEVDVGVIMENSQSMAETMAMEMAKGMSKEMAEQMAGQMAMGMAMDLTHDIAKGIAGGMSIDMARGMAQDMANNIALDQAGMMAKEVMVDLDGDGEFVNMMPPPNQMHQMMGKAHNHAMGMAGEVAFKAGQDMLIGFVKDGLIGVDMLPEGMELPEGFVPPPMPPGPIGAAGIIPPGGQELPPLPAGMENIAQDMVNNVPMPNMPPLADGAMPPMPNMPPIPEGMKNMAADMAGQQAGQMAADMAGQQAQQMAGQMAAQQAQQMAGQMAQQAAQHMAGEMASHQAQHAAQHAAMDMAKDINEGKMPPPPEGMGPPPNGHQPPGGNPPPN